MLEQAVLFDPAELPAAPDPPVSRARKKPTHSKGKAASLEDVQLDLMLGLNPWDEEGAVTQWTEKELWLLHACFLEDQLKQIVDGRVADTTAEEIWNWVWTDEERPFSFRVCTELVGGNPLNLREQFVLSAMQNGVDVPDWVIERLQAHFQGAAAIPA